MSCSFYQTVLASFTFARSTDFFALTGGRLVPALTVLMAIILVGVTPSTLQLFGWTMRVTRVDARIRTNNVARHILGKVRIVMHTVGAPFAEK